MAHDVFVSYSTKDKTIADAVCATLEARKVRCWIAPRDVLPGMHYGEAIIDAINECKVMILILSSSANASGQVKLEVERAVAKGAPIIPLRIEDVLPAKSLEYFIGSVHWLDALTPPMEKHLEYLAETVGLLLSRMGKTEDKKETQHPAPEMEVALPGDKAPERKPKEQFSSAAAMRDELQNFLLQFLSAPESNVFIDEWGRFIDPDNDCSWRRKDGKLIIFVPSTDHDLGVERGLMNAPRVVQPIEGDFILQVKVSGTFKPWDQASVFRKAFHGAGLVVMQDENTYIRLERAAFANPGQRLVYANFELRLNGKIISFGRATDYPLNENSDTLLSLRRHGNKVYGAIKQTGNEWHQLEPLTVPFAQQLQVGVAAVNTSTEAFAPEFSELELTKQS